MKEFTYLAPGGRQTTREFDTSGREVGADGVKRRASFGTSMALAPVRHGCTP